MATTGDHRDLRPKFDMRMHILSCDRGYAAHDRRPELPFNDSGYWTRCQCILIMG